MQVKKMTKEYMLLAIPVELLEESGLCGGELIQITAEENRDRRDRGYGRYGL